MHGLACGSVQNRTDPEPTARRTPIDAKLRPGVRTATARRDQRRVARRAVMDDTLANLSMAS
jgi:hypothetical protein